MQSSPQALRIARCRGARRRQRGIGALVVVMVLFFIVSLVAAYTSRNLIFEQRTAANQYRSTQAFETAEAGLEWALAMLNSGRIDDTCKPVTIATLASPPQKSFRDRFLSTDLASGVITPRTQSDGSELRAACVLDSGNWRCTCPDDGAPTLAAPTGDGVYPAFRVRFLAQNPARAGAVVLQVNACTTLSDSCLGFDTQALGVEGKAVLTTLIALQGGPGMVPAAALTARGNVDVGGAAMSVFNTGIGTSGITIQAGGAINATNLILRGAPGTPAASTLVADDNSLTASSAFTADRMFANTFKVWPDAFKDQPAAVTLACGGGTCGAAAVRNMAALSPHRVLWVQGNLDFDDPTDVGSATDPVLIVATGNVRFSAATHVYGIVYSRAADWSTAGSGQIQGAAIAEGNLAGNSTMSVVYDADILNRMRVQNGSFVRVPGGWRDY